MFIFVLGFLVHIIFLLSVFDAYFKSPLLNGLPVIENSIEARAKRIVLISGDGLRASTAYGTNDNSTPNAPYLRSVIETKASWGVCHTRPPTESRPGHIAMIAGFYEDPSAIFKGWMDNIFEFDSLFNRSALTLGWGSPDIVPMFNKGNLSKNMVMKSYASDMQYFFDSGESTLGLNSWVINAMNETLNIAEYNSSIEGKQFRESLDQDRIFLFLHLLATDASGHSDKPQSQEFLKVLKETDASIKLVIERVEKYYNHDGKTVYVFTSDHGMTDWGSHGDGSHDETETPFIIWGPGVKKPQLVKTTNKDDPWRLSHLTRRDLNIADIVPLLAVLLGISIPVHSVGVLPIDYLDVSEEEIARMLELNMKQINQQYLKSRDTVKLSSIPLFYVPFKDLTDESEAEMKDTISNLIINKKYPEAIFLSQKLIHLNLAAINYYQNYYQYLLLGCISLSYFGWIFVLLTVLCKNLQLKSRQPKSAKSLTSLANCSSYVFTLWMVIVISFILVQSLPLQFYVYGLLPVFLWWFAVKNNVMNVFEGFLQSYRQCWYQPVVYAIGVELFVLTFFQRWAISAVSLALVFWPWFHLQTLRRKKCQFLVYIWTCSTLGITIFPFLPVTGFKPNIYLVVVAGSLSLIFNMSILCLRKLNHCFILKSDGSSSDHYLSLGAVRHIVALSASIAICIASSISQSMKYYQILSWILLGNAIIVPVNMIQGDVSLRLVVLFLAMFSPLLLLSIAHESLFYFIFSTQLLVWFALEYQLVSRVSGGVIGDSIIGEISGRVSPVTWRRGFFLLTFLLMSFFGAGNMASISSFDVLAVQRFISVFSPFTMMSLILLKMLIPFLLVVATVFCLYIKIKDSINELLLVVFIFCDLLGLHFLFLVKNVGSWKEIGMSLSHYVIVEALILFVSLLLVVAHFYLKQLNTKGILTAVGFSYLSKKTYKSKKKNY